MCSASVTVVAGPPVEMQVRVNRGLSTLRSESTFNCILFKITCRYLLSGNKNKAKRHVQ